jgi:hypothetical protein
MDFIPAQMMRSEGRLDQLEGAPSIYGDTK